MLAISYFGRQETAFLRIFTGNIRTDKVGRVLPFHCKFFPLHVSISEDLRQKARASGVSMLVSSFFSAAQAVMLDSYAYSPLQCL